MAHNWFKVLRAGGTGMAFCRYDLCSQTVSRVLDLVYLSVKAGFILSALM